MMKAIARINNAELVSSFELIYALNSEIIVYPFPDNQDFALKFVIIDIAGSPDEPISQIEFEGGHSKMTVQIKTGYMSQYSSTNGLIFASDDQFDYRVWHWTSITSIGPGKTLKTSLNFFRESKNGR